MSLAGHGDIEARARTFLARLELRYTAKKKMARGNRTGAGRASSPNRLTPDRSGSELLPVSPTPEFRCHDGTEVGYGTAQPIRRAPDQLPPPRA